MKFYKTDDKLSLLYSLDHFDTPQFLLMLFSYLQLQTALSSIKLDQFLHHFIMADYGKADEYLTSGINEKLDLEKINALKKKIIDSPKEQHCRRFFDTVLSEELLKRGDNNDPELLGNLISVLKVKNATFDENDNNLINIVGHLRVITTTSTEIRQRTRYLLEQFNFITLKDVMKKPEGFTFYSCHPGIVKANHPCPSDVTSSLSENKLVDLNSINPAINGFASLHKSVPSVSSISGTTCLFLSVLESYVTLQRENDHLEKDINTLINIFIPYTCYHGYHSINEMLAVFKLYNNSFGGLNNIKLNFNPNRPFLNYALSRTIDYCEKILKQDLVHKQLNTLSQSRHSL